MVARALLASFGVHALVLGAGAWLTLSSAPRCAPRSGWMQLDAAPVEFEADPDAVLAVEAAATADPADAESDAVEPEETTVEWQPASDPAHPTAPRDGRPASLARADASLLRRAVSRAPAPSAPPALRPVPRVVAAEATDRNLPPAYPPEALREARSGTVLVEVTVEPDGSVSAISVQASSGSPDLDAAAVRALRAWRFRPATEDGVAIRSRLVQPVEFRIAHPLSARS